MLGLGLELNDAAVDQHAQLALSAPDFGFVETDADGHLASPQRRHEAAHVMAARLEVHNRLADGGDLEEAIVRRVRRRGDVAAIDDHGRRRLHLLVPPVDWANRLRRRRCSGRCVARRGRRHGTAGKKMIEGGFDGGSVAGVPIAEARAPQRRPALSLVDVG